MDPTALVPTPDPISVPAGWFRVFLIGTFFLHILAMNLMVGGAVLAFVAGIKGRKAYVFDALSRSLSKLLTFLIAFTINLGIAPLLFLQVLYGHFFYVSSILMAAIWLLSLGLLLAAYLSAYVYKFKFEQLGGKGPLVIGATVILFILIGFIFSNNLTLMLRPERWLVYFQNPHGTFLNIGEPTLWPRFSHFMTASVAVGGLFIALLGHLKRKTAAKMAKDCIAWGLRWFAHATAVQIAIGFWFLISLPAGIRILFLGGDLVLSGLLLMGVTASVVALMAGLRGRLWPAMTATLATIFSMILVRDQVRNAYLSPFFKLSDLPLEPQYGPLLVFLAALMLGVGVIIFLVRQLGKPVKNPAASPQE